MADIKIKGKIIKKGASALTIQSNECTMEIKKGNIKSPKWTEIKSGQEVEIILKPNAKVNVSISLKDILDAKAKGVKIIAGIDPYCRCECYCVC